MKKAVVMALVLALVLSVSVFAAKAPVMPMGVPDAAMVLDEGWYMVEDPENRGEQEKWYTGFAQQGTAVSLPYTGDTASETVWLYQVFTPDMSWQEGLRIMADFSGCRYYTKVWLNGNYLGDHEGAYGSFRFDVTDFMRQDQENLLVIRLFSPQDGSTVRGNSAQALPLGESWKPSIAAPVTLTVVPSISIADVFVTPNYEDGSVAVSVIVNHTGEETVKINIGASLFCDGCPSALTGSQIVFDAVPGLSRHTVELMIEDFRHWSPEDPYLYTVDVTVADRDGVYSDATTVQVGFKDLRIDSEGFFMLNGSRYYIKSQNLVASQTRYADLVQAKAAGFNTVRFVGGPADAKLLSMCDRLGLLVYQETAMADCEPSADTEDLLRRELRELIVRDRNHASFALVGMFGALETETLYPIAKDALDVVRTYDNDLLVIYGRQKPSATSGTASNPGSLTFDGYMGKEGKGDRAVFTFDAQPADIQALRTDARSNGFSVTLGDTPWDALTEPLADVRLWIRAESLNGYPSDTLNVDISLSNLGKLEQKEYTATLTITGEQGQVYQTKRPLTVSKTKTGQPIFTSSVFTQSISLAACAAGEYQLQVALDDTDIAAVQTFWVSKPISQTVIVYGLGLSDQACKDLAKVGVQVLELDYQNIPAGCTILLGGANIRPVPLQAIYASVAQTGTTVIGLHPDAFGDWGYVNVPLGEKIYQTAVEETRMTDSPLLSVSDVDYYADILPQTAYMVSAPALTVAAQSQEGVQLAAYAYGRGRIVLNTFPILDHIGNPAADHLLLDLIGYAQGGVSR